MVAFGLWWSFWGVFDHDEWVTIHHYWEYHRFTIDHAEYVTIHQYHTHDWPRRMCNDSPLPDRRLTMPLLFSIWKPWVIDPSFPRFASLHGAGAGRRRGRACHKNVKKNIFAWCNCWKTVIFTFWTASITRSKQLEAGPEKSWFLMRKSSGSVKITKTQHLFRQFTLCWSSKSCSELWFFGKSSMGGPYKNHKNATINRFAWGNCWKIVIFTFWTASITNTGQLVAEAEKSWFLMRKSYGSVKKTKISHFFAIYVVLIDFQRSGTILLTIFWSFIYRNYKRVTNFFVGFWTCFFSIFVMFSEAFNVYRW